MPICTGPMPAINIAWSLSAHLHAMGDMFIYDIIVHIYFFYC